MFKVSYVWVLSNQSVICLSFIKPTMSLHKNLSTLTRCICVSTAFLSTQKYSLESLPSSRNPRYKNILHTIIYTKTLGTIIKMFIGLIWCVGAMIGCNNWREHAPCSSFLFFSFPRDIKLISFANAKKRKSIIDSEGGGWQVNECELWLGSNNTLSCYRE